MIIKFNESMGMSQSCADSSHIHFLTGLNNNNGLSPSNTPIKMLCRLSYIIPTFFKYTFTTSITKFLTCHIAVTEPTIESCCKKSTKENKYNHRMFILMPLFIHFVSNIFCIGSTLIYMTVPITFSVLSKIDQWHI